MSERDDSTTSPVTTLRRNNYFYGKLLDEQTLRKEQDYFRNKAALTNRALVGMGVACGLRLSTEGSGNVVIGPGVAIDAAGRELVVDAPVEFDPTRITDASGIATGEIESDTVVEVCLAFRQVCTDPVPVLVPECSGESQCAPCTIQEGISIIVRKPLDEPERLSCSIGSDVSPGPELFTELCDLISKKPINATGESCVSLGRIQISDDEVSVDMCEGRQIVLGNELLFQLILCLAKRVDDIT